MSKLRQQIEAIDQNRKLSGRQKRINVVELREIENRIAARADNVVRKMEGGASR